MAGEKPVLFRLCIASVVSGTVMHRIRPESACAASASAGLPLWLASTLAFVSLVSGSPLVLWAGSLLIHILVLTKIFPKRE